MRGKKPERKVEILRLLAEGHPQRKVAKMVGVCLDTLKTDMQEVAHENGFEEVNTVLLIDFAIREGWFGTPKSFTGVLTERERQVLSLAAQGLTNRLIGRELFLSENTVKGYMRTGYEKIGARNRRHAVMLVRQYGIAA